MQNHVKHLRWTVLKDISQASEYDSECSEVLGGSIFINNVECLHLLVRYLCK